ncbi:MAG: hypothetical protein LQ351_004958 [Letrouitia transgressa]|nr:MAG: hypothetical protein LQ351_004958 [Letrouitia transgressa]
MAAVSTLPSRSDFGRQPISQREATTWDYERPPSRENTSVASKPYPTTSQHSLRRKADIMPLSVQQVNGNAHASGDSLQPDLEDRNRSNGSPPKPSQTPPNIDGSYLSPHRPAKFRPLSDKSRSGSEADSLIDLYGQRRSLAEGTDKGDHDVRLEDLYADEEELENSWIHRDKLALIESQEMAEAGIKLPRQRSKSNLKPKRSHSRNQSSISAKDLDPDPDPDPVTPREGGRQKQRSSVRREAHDDPMDYDLRTPDEIAAEKSAGSTMYHQSSGRQSSSRIPLPTSSPLPIPQGHIERHTPLPRKRGASGNWDEDSIAYNRNRSRSNSVGSRVLIDDSSPSYNTPTPATLPGTLPASPEGPTASPTKSRAVYKPGSVTNARPRTSNGVRNVSEPAKSRSNSTNIRSSPSIQQPKSRSGLEPRPPMAINRPDGEAPWLATMFKPDPRLPPDQQILPTHAKRLQQEQMEREAKTRGTPAQQVPMVVHTSDGLQPPTPSRLIPDGPTHSPEEHQRQTLPNDAKTRPNENELVTPWATATNHKQWPLAEKQPSPGKGLGGNNTNGNSPTESQHAGYSTIPKVQNTLPLGTAGSPKPMVQAPPREQPREKGCGGCCVVM